MIANETKPVVCVAGTGAGDAQIIKALQDTVQAKYTITTVPELPQGNSLSELNSAMFGYLEGPYHIKPAKLNSSVFYSRKKATQRKTRRKTAKKSRRRNRK